MSRRLPPLRSRFGLALLAALSLAATSEPWTGVGRLSGRVAAPDGKPVAGARVALHFETSDGPGPETKSDERGRWSALGLAAGIWHVAVEAEGFVRAEGQAQVPGEGPGPQLRFELRPLAAIAPGATQMDRSVVLGWIEEGNRLLAAGRNAAARAAYEKALPELPPDGRAPVLRAIARSWYAEGKTAEAVAALEKAVAADRYDRESAELLERLSGEVPAAVAATQPAELPRVAPERDRRGSFLTSFAERSPLSEIGSLLRRTGVPRRELESDPARGRYDLASESFAVHVPGGYKREEPHGLVVWVSPGSFGGVQSPAILDLLAERKLIWAGANGAGNPRLRWYRFGLALDAAHNLARLYAIDPERVYVAGYSGGGRVSSVLAVVYPEVFRGGLYMMGCDYFRALPIPDKPGAHWPVLFPKPPGRDLELDKKRNRYVFLTGELDFNRVQTREVHKAYRHDGFEKTTYLESPGIGHYGPVPAADWGRAFDALDGASR